MHTRKHDSSELLMLQSTTDRYVSGSQSRRDEYTCMVHTGRDACQSHGPSPVSWRQGAGATFLRSCSAVTGELNLAGLGAGRTGFG